MVSTLVKQAFGMRSTLRQRYCSSYCTYLDCFFVVDQQTNALIEKTHISLKLIVPFAQFRNLLLECFQLLTHCERNRYAQYTVYVQLSQLAKRLLCHSLSLSSGDFEPSAISVAVWDMLRVLFGNRFTGPVIREFQGKWHPYIAFLVQWTRSFEATLDSRSTRQAKKQRIRRMITRLLCFHMWLTQPRDSFMGGGDGPHHKWRAVTDWRNCFPQLRVVTW